MRALPDRLLAALGTVRDPELDEPVTDLGFVSECSATDDGDVTVHLRLPTYFCAPNFAFLMVADAYDAVRGVPGVRRVQVLLDEHFASDQINAGVAARGGFAAAFGTLADGELDGLRVAFVRKAVLAGTDRVCRPLLAAGRTPSDLAGLTLGEAPAGDDLDRLRARRAELGLPAGDDDPLLLDLATGLPVPAVDAPQHLGRARLTRVGIEANTGICSGMLRDRYATSGLGQKEEM